MDENKKTGPRDVFSYLFGIIALYVSIISFGAVIFSIIDVYLPDPLTSYYGYSAASALRWPLSVLVIFYPLYLWVSWYLQKDLVQNPEKRELKTRRWLLYFTLFAATLVIAGDLISLINQYLNGDLTLRFSLKALVVLVIAAAVWLYYGWNLRKEIPASEHPGMKWFVRGSIAVVLVSIIFGFYVAGSPQTERMKRFDDQRVSDLQNIQYQITYYWQAKQKLPTSISDLRNEISGFIPPIDPETQESYEYRVTGNTSFELCATFNLSSIESDVMPRTVAPYGTGELQVWDHAAGRKCFARTIDPDLYPPLNKPVK